MPKDGSREANQHRPEPEDGARWKRIVYEGYEPARSPSWSSPDRQPRPRRAEDSFAFSDPGSSVERAGALDLRERRDRRQRRPLRRGRSDDGNSATRDVRRGRRGNLVVPSRPTWRYARAIPKRSIKSAGFIAGAEKQRRGQRARRRAGPRAARRAVRRPGRRRRVYATSTFQQGSRRTGRAADRRRPTVRRSLLIQSSIGIDPGAANPRLSRRASRGQPHVVALDEDGQDHPDLPIDGTSSASPVYEGTDCLGTGRRRWRLNLLQEEHALSATAVGRASIEYAMLAAAGTGSAASPTRRRRSRWRSTALAPPASSRSSGWWRPCSACQPATPDHAANALAVEVP